jgi:hypothetical protein
MFPVLEDLAPKEQDPVNHYWLLVMNFRERRFEVLDSVRSISDKSLDQKVNLLVGAIKTLMTHKYRGSQQSSREVKPKFIDSTQGEVKNTYKP